MTKALFGQIAIALGQRSFAQPVLQEGVFGKILRCIHQGIYGVTRLAIIQQHDSVQPRDFWILGVLLH